MVEKLDNKIVGAAHGEAPSDVLIQAGVAQRRLAAFAALEHEVTRDKGRHGHMRGDEMLEEGS